MYTKFHPLQHYNMILKCDYVVNCHTPELAKEFLYFMHCRGHKTCAGGSLLLWDIWHQFREETCYRFAYDNTGFCDTEYYKRSGYEILGFCGINND